jgi:HEAT repeat protein
MPRLIAAIVVVLCVAISPCLADNKADVEKLVQQLKDKDEIVRLKAAKALGKLGAAAKDAIPALMAALKDPDDDVRTVAMAALDKINEAVKQSDQEESLANLARNLKRIKSDDPKVRKAAIAAMGKLLKDVDEIIRAKAAKALGEAGLESRDVAKELDEATKDQDATVREAARKALAKVQEAVAKEAKDKYGKQLEPLLRDLKDKSATTRLKAIEKIGEMGKNAAAASEALVVALLDKVPAINEAALEALEKVNPIVHTPLVTIMVDRMPSNKLAAVAALGKLKSDGRPAVPLLLRFYQLQTAPGNLAHYFGPTVLRALRDIDPDDKAVCNLIMSAIVVYRNSLHPSDRNSIIDSESRNTAIELTLDLIKDMKIKGKDAVKPLLGGLGDRQCVVQAIKALGEIGVDAKDAIPALTRLKRSEIKEIRDAATEALKNIK